jgi:hypothetical protein
MYVQNSFLKAMGKVRIVLVVNIYSKISLESRYR